MLGQITVAVRGASAQGVIARRSLHAATTGLRQAAKATPQTAAAKKSGHLHDIEQGKDEKG